MVLDGEFAGGDEFNPLVFSPLFDAYDFLEED